MSSHSETPTKDDVVRTLESLIRGDLSREDASEWARPWITRLHHISDPEVRRGIDWLYGADAPTTDRPYLHGEEDFEQWLSDLSR
jgi:hypothetical protein